MWFHGYPGSQGSGAFKAPLKGELAGPKGLTEGFRGRYLRSYRILGEYAQSPLASPGGKPRGPVRIRLSLGKNVTAHRTPQPLRRPQPCIKQLYAVKDGYTR